MNEKIISVLKTFNSSDIKDFKKFILSPYFSTGRDLTKYYECIMKYHPDFEISKEKFLKSYFGKLDDKEGKQSKILRTLNSDFSKILDDYIAVDSLKNMNFYYNYLLIEGYSHRALYALGEKKAEETLLMEEDLDSGFIREIQMILLKNLIFHFKSLTNKNPEIYGVVESQSEDLITFFVNISSHLLNSLKVNSESYNIQRKTEQLSLLINNIELDKFLDNLRPDYPNYKKIKLDIILLCTMLKNKKFEHLYMKLNEVYMDTFDTLDHRHKMNYFTSVLNYYTANPSEQTIQLKFEFVKFGLSQGLFPSGEIIYINAGTFKMFMLAGLHAGDIDWTEKYIEEYAEKLNPDFKENMLNYSYAYLNHYKGDYITSLDYISKFRFANEVFTYDMKLMQLKNFYELMKQSESYLENINYAIDAFSHYLKDNKKVSENYRKSGKDFIAGMKLLVKFTAMLSDKEEKKKEMYDLEKFMSETKNVWLISKIKELIYNR
ncbi:MAG: hypothetical protein JST55_16590 [Bacteroidetes bacterium]|nr:hypothetical protein [Bacteroidota bacterium]